MKCTAVTNKGRRCNGDAMRGQRHCPTHGTNVERRLAGLKTLTPSPRRQPWGIEDPELNALEAEVDARIEDGLTGMAYPMHLSAETVKGLTKRIRFLTEQLQ